ncbi:hypothetical protein Angca_001779, partial [Angiostrongylus cantonensis]
MGIRTSYLDGCHGSPANVKLQICGDHFPDMARKRTEKEGSKNAADDVQEDERCIEAVHNGDPELDYRILSIPSLRIQEIIDRSTVATLADLGETLSSASDWLHEENAKARELIRKIARAGAVRKTPHHGKPFASIRNTAENYRNSIFSIGIRDVFSDINDVETKSGDSDVSSTRGAIHVKEEVFSISRPTTTSTASDAVSEADRRVVTRSTAKEKAAKVETKDRPVKSGRLRQRQLLSTVAEVQKGMNKRVAAGLSQTRLRRAVRQHGVTTPCKREYKEAVQRVVIEQDLMRNSANRGLVPTPTRLDHGVPNVPVAALSHPRTPHPNPKIALRREKEELAAQLREEQCRERAERVRKEREEKALRVQRRRQQREIEERLKAEARKQKEIRDERRREELRQQKSPARCKATSEFVSPARAAGVNANAKVHVGSKVHSSLQYIMQYLYHVFKVLFPCTPGRSSAKLAKMLFSPGGGPRREPTMITVSPGGDVSNRQAFSREERNRIMQKEQERQERFLRSRFYHAVSLFPAVFGLFRFRFRLREEERRRVKVLDEQQGLVRKKLYNNDTESETQGSAPKEGGKRFIYEQNKSCLPQKEGNRMSSTKDTQDRENVLLIKKGENVEVSLEDFDKRDGEWRKLEHHRVHEGKEHLEINEEKPLCTEEQENMAQCLNTSSSMKLHNRHLDNVIMNTSNVSHKSASRHSSYEITRGKVDKPLSENNYSIEDLSSGDETDQEEAPRKKVPSWAVGKEFQCELRRQAAILRSGEFDLSEYFGEVE